MIKAIETFYKGYKFRSLLEARWAVFFDALEIKWEYELEGFDLTEQAQSLIKEYSDPESEVQHMYRPADIDWLKNALTRGRLLYLPDFYLPSLNKFIEVKPYLGGFSWGMPEHTPINLLGGYLLHGMPGTADEETYEVCTFFDVPYFFGYCPSCKAFDVGFYAWKERICKTECPDKSYRKTDMSQSYPMLQAIVAARSARFEHGEKP